MTVVTYPNRTINWPFKPVVFLAGGISNCPDWQTEVIDELSDIMYLTLLNPRREAFDLRVESESAKQIEWEHYMLNHAGIVSFWFPKETLCPITLLELGKMMMTDKKLIVGCDPEYKRRFDVEKQLQLERPEVVVVDSLKELILTIREETGN